MNLFLRLIRIFLSAIFSKKELKLGDTATLNFRVWLTDQDMFAHMTNSRYLSFGDLGTINYIIRSGYWGALRKKGWFPVINAQSMSISRMLKTPQKFEVRSTIVGWNETYVGLKHEFYSRDRLHAVVNVVARFASRDRSKVTPQMVIEAGSGSQLSLPLPPEFQEIVDKLEATRVLSLNKAA